MDGHAHDPASRIEKLRIKLACTVARRGSLQHREVLALSRQIDELVNEVQETLRQNKEKRRAAIAGEKTSTQPADKSDADKAVESR